MSNPPSTQAHVVGDAAIVAPAPAEAKKKCCACRRRAVALKLDGLRGPRNPRPAPRLLIRPAHKLRNS
jgi:hypothetical protein